MTKARDLANLISGGFTEADIPNLSASKITSGTFADARIASSNVSQHATSFDDNKIVNDISTLALRQASDENKSAYNTNSSSVDVFQDSTGITNLTNVSNVSEYLATVYTQTTNLNYGLAGGTQNGGTNFNSTDFTGYDGVTRAGGKVEGTLGSNYSAYNFNYVFPANTPFELIMFSSGVYQGCGYWHGSSLNKSYISYGNSYYDSGATNITYNSTNHPFTGQGVTFYGQYHAPTNGDGGSNFKNFYRFRRDSSNSFTIQYYGRTTGTLNIDATNIANTRNASTYVTTIGTARTISDQMILGLGEASGASDSTRISVEVANAETSANNATGSFEGNTVTAPSSVSSMGAIITYQDQAGTNALNTDIVLKLSADNGSNYSTATLTAMPDFSSGIKMAKVNDLTVTAGTQLKYKLEFANQASGSKEARIRGVSLQY